MLSPVIDSIIGLLEAIFNYKVGTEFFNLMLGVCVLAWILVARIFMAMFSSARGILAALIALVIPVAVGLLAYGMAELHLVPLVEADWAKDCISYAVLGFFLFSSVILISSRVFKLTAGVTIFIYVVAMAAATGVYFGAQVTIGVIESGGEQMEQRERRARDQIDSLF